MAEIILSKAQGILKAHKDVIGPLLAPAASTNRHACLAPILAGANPVPALEFATQQVDQELAPRDRQPGQITWYAGAADSAVFASALDLETRKQVAQTFLDRSLDRTEATVSRRDSLKGLFNIIPHVDDETRATLLPPVLEMARGEHDVGPFDGAAGRFSAFTINMGSSTLAAVALECATRLAADDSHAVAIVQIGIALLRSSEEPSQWRIGSALALLPTVPDELNLDHCAAHPSPALRAVAAVRWARDPAALPPATAVQLARDDDHRVRQVLARVLRDDRDPGTIDETTRTVIDILAADPRRSVRTYMIGLTSGPSDIVPA